jgi:hypothetical protein
MKHPKAVRSFVRDWWVVDHRMGHPREFLIAPTNSFPSPSNDGLTPAFGSDYSIMAATPAEQRKE